MRQLLLFAVLVLGPGVAAAFEIEERARFGPSDAQQELRIISTADIAYFETEITPFLTQNPDVAIEYIVASSTDLMQALNDDQQSFDLAISSAMDLQTKLANDGKARTYSSPVTAGLPEWAAWNDMLFAFTQEPAAIVVSRAAFVDMDIPETRQDLISLLRQHPELFEGRVGTYDVRRSGLGYLFATQDTRASETYWRLTEVMGSLNARLYCCSSDMIDAVRSGDLAIAYNVLGSYALNRTDATDIAVVLPADFTTVMMRTALIPQTAANPDMAGTFIDYLLQRAHGQDTGSTLRSGIEPSLAEPILNRIRIGPGLLVYLDQLKRRAFLAEWQSAILQN